jgi:hypothetical protein
VYEDGRQGVVEGGTDSPNQLRFGDSKIAVVTRCGADRSEQGLLAFTVETEQHVKAVVENRDSELAVGLVAILLCPGSEGFDTRSKRCLSLIFIIVAVVGEDAQ